MAAGFIATGAVGQTSGDHLVSEEKEVTAF